MKQEQKKYLSDTVQILCGSFLLALSVSAFILPFNILSGGVAGVAVALSVLLRIDSTFIINALMILLLFVGRLFLGKKFVLSTILSTLLYLVFVNLLNRISWDIAIEPLLASLYAGILGGIGVGLVFRAGASTGGMDIPPLIIHKYTNMKLSTLVMITDLITVALGLASYGIAAVLIGLISVYSSAYAIDKVLTFGSEKAKSVYIISNRLEEINHAIHERLERGTTILNGKGGYTKDDKEVLLLVLTASQYPELMRIIKEIDAEAFLIVQDANEVHGNGFSFDYKI